MTINVKYRHDDNHYNDVAKRNETSNVWCDCGSKLFHVNFIQGPYCGCYMKITCDKCGESDVLFDDYA